MIFWWHIKLSLSLKSQKILNLDNIFCFYIFKPCDWSVLYIHNTWLLILFLIFAIISNLLILTKKYLPWPPLFSHGLVRTHEEGSRKNCNCSNHKRLSHAWWQQFIFHPAIPTVAAAHMGSPHLQQWYCLVHLFLGMRRQLFSWLCLQWCSTTMRLQQKMVFSIIFAWFFVINLLHDKFCNVELNPWNTMILLTEIVDSMVDNVG